MGFIPFSESLAVGGNLSVGGNVTVGGTVNGAVIPIEDPWLPPDNILVASTGDPDAYSSTNATMIAGTLYLSKIMIRQAITATNICVGVEAAGSGASTGCFAGLYSSAGLLLSGSADCAAAFTATAPDFQAIPLTTPQALAAGTFVWAALLSNLATTQPALFRNGGAGSLIMMNANLTAAFKRSCVNGTGLTALPSPSITPSANTSTGAFPFWTGIS